MLIRVAWFDTARLDNDLQSQGLQCVQNLPDLAGVLTLFEVGLKLHA